MDCLLVYEKNAASREERFGSLAQALRRAAELAAGGCPALAIADAKGRKLMDDAQVRRAFVTMSAILEETEPAANGEAPLPPIEIAKRVIAEHLDGDHRRLAEYWLTLWDGDQLPRRVSFRPERVRDLLPGIAVFEVKPNVSVHCRIAGTAFLYRFGLDIAQKDWIELTAPSKRTLRLERNTRIAQGAISFCRRLDPNRPQGAALFSDVQLPFRAEPDGTVCYLHHSDWRPRNSEYEMARTRLGEIAPAEEFRPFDLFPLAA